MVDSSSFFVMVSDAEASRNPLDTVCLTGPQREFASVEDPLAIWRDGNQLGKSYALAWDLIHCCRGTHPYRARRNPGAYYALIAGVSYEQMIPLMEKIWNLLPKDEIDPDNGFEPGRGITGKPPRIVFTSGPGKGAVINFATYAAGAKRIAGSTLDYFGLDEPPEETFFGEVMPRVLRRRGVIRSVFTPTPDMPDLAWLREKVEKKQIRELNFGLCAEHVHPEGYPVPWLSQREIDIYSESLFEYERAMRIEGAWVALTVGRWLSGFSDENVREIKMSDVKGWDLTVGMDHGTPGGKQCAVLLAVADRASDRPRVAFLEESVNTGLTSPENDAQAVLDMLERRGLKYDNVDFWIGDVPTESKIYGIRKSNKEIRYELARLLKRPLHATKYIPEPKKHSQSMTIGYRVLNTLFGRRTYGDRPDAIIDPRMEQFIAGCWNFKGDPRDPLKDVLDGGRYGVEHTISSRVLPMLSASY